jgi:hypothetical protein
MAKAPNVRKVLESLENTLNRIENLGAINAGNHPQYKILVAQAVSLAVGVPGLVNGFVKEIGKETRERHKKSVEDKIAERRKKNGRTV